LQTSFYQCFLENLMKTNLLQRKAVNPILFLSAKMDSILLFHSDLALTSITRNETAYEWFTYLNQMTFVCLGRTRQERP